MPLSPEEIAEIVHATDNALAELRLFIAATGKSLAVFDTRTSVEHIWKREYSPSAMLFCLVRYSGLVNTLFVVLVETGRTGISDKSAPTVTFRHYRGVLYFGVLLIANLIGLILVRFLALIQPMNTWIAMCVSSQTSLILQRVPTDAHWPFLLMTYRFILDLHEAADPRFELEDLTTAAGGGDTSALIFVATSKHAPRFDSERSPPSGTGTSDTGWFDQSLEDGRSVAECDHFAPEWHWQVRRSQNCLEAGTDGRGVVVSRRGDVDSVIWIR
ncbi:uncharacterized protein TRAVEDRAFT_51248 [Trametes versicolor FP-101664 SS1]|uniref:uncharacterized protein n=1 Tax=Trametes versicolor (strain FP-101664) TaxID=717944 RepID=UPI0004624136|nr:uncharacterized protein TRAVEDRAFT_51248 [Trametes versicolor FP-101664 SS1]EIW55124.1 hypothetical protein TRAVEDRAFT_51248 [Trametes versicolor FP-101664 SS1]